MNTLKPFDLDAALRGEPVVTRDGRKADLHLFKWDLAYPLAVYIERNHALSAYSKTGMLFKDGTSPDDLMMAPRTKKLWIAISKKNNTLGISGIHQISSAFADKTLIAEFTDDWIIKEIEIEV